MTTAIIIFMAFAVVLSLFSVLIITKEVVEERLEKRKLKAAESKPAEMPKPQQSDEPQPIAETEEEPIVQEETATAEVIRFAPRTVQTLEEKYLALDGKSRGYYDEIVKYALAQENVKRIKNARYEEYKAGNTRLVRLLVKRGVVVCEFVLPNADFKNYINENKVNVKLASTVMRITDEGTVQAAKDSIDIVVNALAQEREYKKQLARERRKENRRKEKEQR
ncbi:MAG: hypothetical protein IJZ32_03985 [Clostridia bacterium]|nr:hypothetical protein [Clostridia bacterium]